MFEEIMADLQALPELKAWPEIGEVFLRAGEMPRPDWELPILACRACGGSSGDARIAAAAVACLQISIILVDDMLDEDEGGEYVYRGFGPTANLALAFQAAALRLIQEAPYADELKAPLFNQVAHIALATAAGQNLDVQNLQGEEAYWIVIKAKSTPFYGGAVKLGALIAGADPIVVEQLRQFGVLIGEIIQLQDDLGDALAHPMNADWVQKRNNLLIMYARTADHPFLGRFEDLLQRINEPNVLEEAQNILLKSGAVSYCAYLMVDKFRNARSLIRSTALADPDPLNQILDDYAKVLLELLQTSGVRLSESDLLIG